MSESGAGLSASGLSRLLDRLDPDPDRAALAYESLRHTLLSFFNWRGAWAPEECADQTLDRLAAKLDQGLLVGDVRPFARGIARLVLLEAYRRPEARAARADESELDRLPAAPEGQAEPLHDCLERCLARLPDEGRDLILRYYVNQGRLKIESRRRLAAELGTSEGGLRSRAQRVRNGLERCVNRCLAEGDTKL